MTAPTRRARRDGSSEHPSPTAGGRPGDRATASPPASDAGPDGRRARWVTIGLPALLAYLPLLFTHPGMVGADTKTYLYLDPYKLLSSAPYVWDAQIGLGTVTHQNIGYLWPMGPFYILFDQLRVPDWIAQRLWLGSVMFAAAMGVRYLLRALNETRVVGQGDPADRRAPLGPAALLVASLAYMFSPYLLDYSARISVILLPWAALPWLIALTAKSLRHAGWRYPAWFAFVVLAVGGINATALLLVGLGPLLWVLHAVFVDREVTMREALAAVGRVAALTVATSLWWIAGLWAEGRYGLPVIRYTESYRAVASNSSAPEVIRGLGYWFFYGTDKLGPWIEPSVEYTNWLWLIALSYLLPVLAFVSASLLRWRYRSYFIGLIVVGTLVSVASHPWDSPSLLGGVFKTFTRSDAGLSLRSTPRAVPLIVLATAVFLGAGVEALGRRLPRLALPAAVLACLLIVANIPPMWTNTMVAKNLERKEEIPGYWRENAAYLQARGTDTRVLELPGADFASYRWGNTVDPVLPGLMTRSYVARELFTWGSPQSANLLNAYDRRLHEDLMDPDALVPIAQLMGVGDVNLRSDLQYERYRVARPRQLWDLIRRAPGLGEPATFGPTDPPNRSGHDEAGNLLDPPYRFTLQDEVELSSPPDLPEPPRVAAFPVEDARPILRAVSGTRPMLMAGDGDGLVDAAGLGLVHPDQAVFYSASLVNDTEAWDRVYGNGADLVVTDSNRKRARRWGALRENTGYTERAGEKNPVFDPSDQRLDVFPGAGEDAYTVTEQRAVDVARPGAIVTATGYGNPFTFTPDDRAANAFDGDPLTAWRTGALGEIKDESLRIDLNQPVTADHLTLLQPINLERTRWLTKVRLTFEAADGSESSLDVDLDERSRDENARYDRSVGQVVDFPARTFRRLRVAVLDTNVGLAAGWGGLSGIGLAEVTIPGVSNEEVVRPPSDLLTRAGASSADHRLTMLFTRSRSNPAEPVRGDEEMALRRLVDLPTARSFAVRGQARISGLLDGEKPGHAIDTLLGMPDHTRGGVTAEADVHLPGSLEQRASASIDGDPTTFWSSIFQKQTDHYLEYTVAAPLTFDHLDLDIVNDGRHSLPRRLALTVDGVDRGVIEIPPLTHQDTPNGTVHVRVPLPAEVTGSKLRFTIAGVDEHLTDEWYSDGTTASPVAIAEIGVPGLHLAKPAETFDSGCRTDLLSVDQVPVPVRITGRTADALARRAMPVEPCTPTGGGRVHDGNGFRLDPGQHVIRTGTGRDPTIGLDIDRLAFASAAGGDALVPAAAATADTAAPPAKDVSLDRVDGHLTIEKADKPFWLVLGQSWSTGWSAQVNGTELGAPVPINGYGNGWYVDPAVVGSGPLSVAVTWEPQRIVWVFIGVSVLAGVLCLLLMFRRARAVDRSHAVVGEPGRPLDPQFVLSWPAPIRWRAGDDVDDPDAVIPGPVRALFAAGALGVFAYLNLPGNRHYPLLALPLAAVLYLALRRRHGRSLLGLAGAGSLAAAGAYIVAQQFRHNYPSNGVWAILMGAVHVLGVVAVLLLGAEGVRELVRHRVPRTSEGDTDLDTSVVGTGAAPPTPEPA